MEDIKSNIEGPIIIEPKVWGDHEVISLRVSHSEILMKR